MIAAVDTEAARHALAALEGAIYQAATGAIREAVEAAEKDARATTMWNDRTGLLRSKIDGASFRTSGTLTADTPYARYLENGTRPHVITGNPTLSFIWHGQRVFFRRVNHPGTAPRPFMAHAGAEGQRILDAAANFLTAYAIEKFNA